MPVRDILHKAVEAAYAEVTANAARALLLNRRGQLYRSFPSKRALEWALEAARRRGLPEQGRWDPPLLYACLRRVYKSLEFDLGWSTNLGWAYMTHPRPLLCAGLPREEGCGRRPASRRG